MTTGQANSDGRSFVVDEAYEDPDKILEALEVPDDEDAVEHYGFQDETELVNYIFGVIALQPEDLNRMTEYFENPRCPYCEILEPETDPTLGSFTDEIENEAPYQPDIERLEHEVTNLFCDTHLDAWVEYRETEKYEE